MTRPLRFEAFDDVPAPAPPAGPSPDWCAGHAQGLADAAADAARRSAAAEEAALSALADLRFTYAEARAAVLAALAPFFRELSERLIPDVAGQGFPLHLAEHLSRIAAADTANPPLLELSPADAARVMPVLAAAGFSDITPRTDTGLPPGEARISRGRAATALDTPALVAGLAEVIAALLHEADNPQTEGRHSHG